MLPGKYHVGLKLDSWANVKDQFRFEVAVLNRDGTPAVDVPVTVNAFQRQVYSHRKKLIGGTYAYENQVYDRPLDDEAPAALCRAQKPTASVLQNATPESPRRETLCS